jgi:hypothetical protein
MGGLRVVGLDLCEVSSAGGEQAQQGTRASKKSGRGTGGATVCGERSEQQDSLSSIVIEAAIEVRTAGNEEEAVGDSGGGDARDGER